MAAIEPPVPAIDPPGIPRPDEVDSPSPGALDESGGEPADEYSPELLGTAAPMTTEQNDPHDPLEPDLPDPAPEREKTEDEEPAADDGAATDVQTDEPSG